MSKVSIRETVISPMPDEVTVRLFISDAPRDHESATIRLDLTATIQSEPALLLADFQKRALEAVQGEISAVLQVLADETQKAKRAL
jgi:hypothetical protein